MITKFLKNNYLLILILLLAVFFRFFMITTFPNGLFPDEAANGLDINSIFHGHLQPFYERGNGREALFFWISARAFEPSEAMIAPGSSAALPAAGTVPPTRQPSMRARRARRTSMTVSLPPIGYGRGPGRQGFPRGPVRPGCCPAHHS